MQSYEVGRARLVADKHSPDLSQLKAVRIDESTIIFIKDVQDREQVREAFLERIRESEQQRLRGGYNSKPKQDGVELSYEWNDANAD